MDLIHSTMFILYIRYIGTRFIDGVYKDKSFNYRMNPNCYLVGQFKIGTKINKKRKKDRPIYENRLSNNFPAKFSSTYRTCLPFCVLIFFQRSLSSHER